MYGSFGAGDAAVLGLCKECGYRVKFRFFLVFINAFSIRGRLHRQNLSANASLPA